MEKEERIAALESELQDIKRRWPAHSVKPDLIKVMEDLEEELAKLINETKEVDCL